MKIWEKRETSHAGVRYSALQAETGFPVSYSYWHFFLPAAHVSTRILAQGTVVIPPGATFTFRSTGSALYLATACRKGG